jgi:hypothetical protein
VRVVRGVSGDTYRRCKSSLQYLDVLIFRYTKLHESHESKPPNSMENL